MTDRSADASRWARINEIFHAALEQPADRRRAYLGEAAAGDADLYRELESLLGAHGGPGGALDLPDAGAADRGTRALAEGLAVGPYRVERVLGMGGMGVVYLAEDTRLGRRVALKALVPSLTDDPRRRERLRREARAAAALTHPNVATVFALEEIGGALYLAVEFVPGESLRDLIDRGPVPLDGALRIGRQMARALAAAHDRGIVHRDLKPENVIRTPDGVIKVLDFGIAHLLESEADGGRLTEDGAALGTPGYMSPEQIRAEGTDGRSDLFSFGVVMFELVSGHPPFAAATPAATMASVLEATPPVLTSPGAPAALSDRIRALDEVLRVCLQKVREARYPSAHDLVRAFDGLGSDRWTASRAGPAAPPASGRTRFWWQFHQAAASAVYLALLVPLWWTRDWHPGIPGQALGLGGLTAALVAVTLRLHLWFTWRELPGEWSRQRRRSMPWIRVSDAAFAAVLLASGLVNLGGHAETGFALVAAAVAVVLSFAVIEPATARAAITERRA